MDDLRRKLTAWATRSATGDPQRPGSTIILQYVHPSHRRRKVAARRQPIPQSIEVAVRSAGWGLHPLEAPPRHSAHS
jgi:hypothetical protein